MKEYLLQFVLKIMKIIIFYYLTQEFVDKTKNACLDRFYPLFDLLLEFLVCKDNDLRLNLINPKNDTAFTPDLFAKFNETHLMLKSNELNSNKTKIVVFTVHDNFVDRCNHDIFLRWQ